MGLLNHLFGGKKGLAQKLVLDEKRRLALWEEHIANYPQREELAKHFSFKNVERATEDRRETTKVLTKIEALIHPDLINIGEEEKLEEEIVADLNKLKDAATFQLQTIVEEKKKQELLLPLFQEIHDTLIVELYLISLIKKKLADNTQNRENIKDLLLKLFRLINFKEAMLYKLFRKESYFEQNLPQYDLITKIARAVILQEKLEKEIETEEDIFAKEMFEKMAELEYVPEESKHEYHQLAEDIFFVLTGKVGAPRPRDEDLTIAIGKMERIIRNDATMSKIVKKLRPKYGEAKIKAAIRAFRKAYNNLHFEHLMGEFAT